jgi:cytochrome o ubiquinol oxidase subunit 3
VLRNNTFGTENAQELASLPFVLTETLILLTSSFTAGLAILALHNNKKNQVMVWLLITFLLGISFLFMEINEFSRLVADGLGPDASASLSSFFTLVGTHGLHIAVGLLWIIVSLIQIMLRGLTPFISSKLIRFSLFWHFLDVVWIFIFTFVYLISRA